MPMQETERLSDVVKLSAHVTRVLGQNPGMMTLQGTNSYILQPPSNPLAPIILVDTSSPHTAQQYIDVLFTHLYGLGLGEGLLETHFESTIAQRSLDHFPEERHDGIKASILAERKNNGKAQEYGLYEYGDGSTWSDNFRVPNAAAQATLNGGRRIPNIEHIILTHRHLDHVGALPLLLRTLKSHGCPPPKLWKLSSPDEAELCASERDRPTSDGAIWQSLTAGTYQPFSPLQPFHPIIPGLMISILDPQQRHLLVHEKDGKPRWNDVPEIARVSVRCLKTPGHTKDSISLVMLEGEKGVFTGDTVLGQGTSAFAELGPYMTSLRTLLALKPQTLYPAHGPHLPNSQICKSHIETYISHRQQREDEITSILRSQSQGSLAETIIALKRELHEKAEKENAARGPLMMDRRKAVPMPEFEEEKRALDEAVRLLRGAGGCDDSQGSEESGSGVHAKAENKESAVPATETETETETDKDEDKDDQKDTKPIPNSVPVPLAVLKRLLYRSEKEKLLFAASKSVNAHLVKLEQEGKVRKTRIMWPKMVEKDVGEREEQEAWEWVGEKEEEEEEEEKIKVD